MILLVVTLLFSLIDSELFLLVTKTANTWILKNFDWLFSWSVLAFVGLLVIIYFMPFGKVIIGGKDSKPLFNKWRWFSITLCTSIATGILFWGTAEPLFHYNAPPESLGITPRSEAAFTFSLATIFMHWTFSPYAIYTLAALLFAYAFYNQQQPFEVSSMLHQLMKSHTQKVSNIADIICLYGLVAGMSASLGAGILTLMGAFQQLFDIPSSILLIALIAVTIVLTFIISAASGMMKGIRTLSDYNIKGFIILGVFVFIAGPTTFILKQSGISLIDYGSNFLPRSINWSGTFDDDWFQSWTVFNWANWLAWAPITALFLGRLGRGYSVQTFIRFNLIYPSLFGILWMGIFSGSALYFDRETQGALFQVLNEQGPENVIYKILEKLPATKIVGVLFLLLTFLSYVTAADSNTSAMSGVCTKGLTAEHAESPLMLKVIWGSIIGILACVMISFSGMEGIKIISVLGGFPALFLMIAVGFSAIRLILTEK